MVEDERGISLVVVVGMRGGMISLVGMVVVGVRGGEGGLYSYSCGCDLFKLFYYWAVHSFPTLLVVWLCIIWPSLAFTVLCWAVLALLLYTCLLNREGTDFSSVLPSSNLIWHKLFLS
jgi:hypothetical protein